MSNQEKLIPEQYNEDAIERFSSIKEIQWNSKQPNYIGSEEPMVRVSYIEDETDWIQLG